MGLDFNECTNYSGIILWVRGDFYERERAIRFEDFAPWYLNLVFIFVMGSLFVAFASVVFGNPGVIPASDTAADFVEAVETLSTRINYCFTCWVARPTCSKHCATCDRCVADFDHHCPWLHQCITKRNLRGFMAFVFCVGLSSAIYSGVGIRFFALQIRDHGFEYFIAHHTFYLLTVLLAILHACMMTALFIQQMIQISSAVTTNERIMAHRRQKHAAQQQQSTTSGDQTTNPSDPAGYYHYKLTCSDRIENLLNFLSGSYRPR